ncbi:MAG: methyltransferase [Thermodesulfobacteria bacterium]|nr:methyltransferase [Thermodesulfobacteriota bacterium]
MEYRPAAKNFLHVKIAPRGFKKGAFSHPSLVNLFEEPEALVLVFEPEDVNSILRDLLDFAPGADILETGLYPSAGPVSGYRLRYAEGLVIVSPGGEITPREGEIVLKTNFSFGSGFHPTTKLSARLLAEAFEKERPARVFDLGTGSGVLALCAAKLGAREILAADIDPRAVREARANVLTNGYEEQILVVQGSLSCARRAFFDLLLANLTIGTILTLGKEFPALLRPGGRMILSGFMLDQVAEVKNLFPQAEAEKVLAEEGWAALLCRI